MTDHVYLTFETENGWGDLAASAFGLIDGVPDIPRGVSVVRPFRKVLAPAQFDGEGVMISEAVFDIGWRVNLAAPDGYPWPAAIQSVRLPTPATPDMGWQ